VIQVHELGADDDEFVGQGAKPVRTAGDRFPNAVAEEPGVVFVRVEQNGWGNVGGNDSPSGAPIR
jgi:hypothetical protein